jgi:hypothetical protein
VRDEEFAMHSLGETLKLLALEAGQQRAVLPDYVVVPDELALTFDDAYQQVGELEKHGRLTAEQREPLDGIKRGFSDTEADDHFWTLASLSSDPRWQEIRHQASQALHRLGIAAGWPTLDWISYVADEEP